MKWYLYRSRVRYFFLKLFVVARFWRLKNGKKKCQKELGQQISDYKTGHSGYSVALTRGQKGLTITNINIPSRISFINSLDFDSQWSQHKQVGWKSVCALMPQARHKPAPTRTKASLFCSVVTTPEPMSFHFYNVPF